MAKMTDCYHGPDKIVEFNGDLVSVPDHGLVREFYGAFRSPRSMVGMAIDHICGDPRCLNPDHMRLVTLRENFGRRG